MKIDYIRPGNERYASEQTKEKVEKLASMMKELQEKKKEVQNYINENDDDLFMFDLDYSRFYIDNDVEQYYKEWLASDHNC